MEKATESKIDTQNFIVPKKGFSLEFFVGLFTLIGVLCAGWLAVGLGGVEWFKSDTYDIFAEFDNISGLKTGASVEIAGVPIGNVNKIDLKDPVAKVTLRINNSVPIKDDDIASIRTKGIIGDRYVKISRGGSEDTVKNGGTLTETESVVDIEDLIGKIVHNMTNDSSKGDSSDDKEKSNN